MTPGKSLAEHFRLTEELSLEPRYNIAPTQPVLTIRIESESRKAKIIRWGLIPHWAKDIKIGARLINARSETAAQRPAFRDPFRIRRCLIPADGFYEWKKVGKKIKPHLVTLRDRSPFAFAGLWDSWKSQNGEIIESCSILTTDANELIRPVHERMPSILSQGDYKLWLDQNIKAPGVLKNLLKPFPPEKMMMFPVSEKVNKASYEAADCVEPLTGSDW